MVTRKAHGRCRRRIRLGAAGMAMVALAACGPAVEVRTAAAPEAITLGRRQTFRIVEIRNDSARTANGDGDLEGYGIKDPMIHNSITSQAVHDQIREAFEARGYRYAPDAADFEIAYEATVAPIMDIRSYDVGSSYYGHPWYSHGYRYGSGYYDGWGCCGYGGFGYATASYDRSTVIIDAVEPSTGKLLWRGQGTADMYTDPQRYMKDLRHAVKAIARKFPPANGELALIAQQN